MTDTNITTTGCVEITGETKPYDGSPNQENLVFCGAASTMTDPDERERSIYCREHLDAMREALDAETEAESKAMRLTPVVTEAATRHPFWKMYGDNGTEWARA